MAERRKRPAEGTRGRKEERGDGVQKSKVLDKRRNIGEKVAYCLQSAYELRSLKRINALHLHSRERHAFPVRPSVEQFQRDLIEWIGHLEHFS